MLMLRQVISFFNSDSINDDTTEVFYSLKLLLLFIMVVVYHSHFAIRSEKIRIVIILGVYAVVGIALMFKIDQCKVMQRTLTEILSQEYGLIITFTFVGFMMNFSITLIVRYFQEELLKYFNSKMKQQQEFEKILLNLEDSILSFDR